MQVEQIFAIQKDQPLYVKAFISPNDIKFDPLEYNPTNKELIIEELEKFGFYQKVMKNIIASTNFDKKTNKIQVTYKRLPFARNPEKITLDLPNKKQVDILVCWSM